MNKIAKDWAKIGLVGLIAATIVEIDSCNQSNERFTNESIEQVRAYQDSLTDYLTSPGRALAARDYLKIHSE